MNSVNSVNVWANRRPSLNAVINLRISYFKMRHFLSKYLINHVGRKHLINCSSSYRMLTLLFTIFNLVDGKLLLVKTHDNEGFIEVVTNGTRKSNPGIVCPTLPVFPRHQGLGSKNAN